MHENECYAVHVSAGVCECDTSLLSAITLALLIICLDGHVMAAQLQYTRSSAVRLATVYR
jgi:hypothetical protein